MVSFPFSLYYSEKKPQYQQQTINSLKNDPEKQANTTGQILWDSMGAFTLHWNLTIYSHLLFPIF